jgi:hypothetical protein
MDKPKGKVQRIELSEEDQTSIDEILNGESSPFADREKLHIIRERYKIGNCLTCREFPAYKVTYDYDGITLVEWYCESHFKKGDYE